MKKIYDAHKQACMDGKSKESIRCDLGQALRCGCYYKSRKIVEWLLTLPEIDVNGKNGAGYTALMSASGRGNVDIVKILLNVKGIDYKYKAKDNESMISVSSHDSVASQEIEEYMIEKGLLTKEEIIKLKDDANQFRKARQTKK